MKKLDNETYNCSASYIHMTKFIQKKVHKKKKKIRNHKLGPTLREQKGITKQRPLYHTKMEKSKNAKNNKIENQKDKK